MLAEVTALYTRSIVFWINLVAFAHATPNDRLNAISPTNIVVNDVRMNIYNGDYVRG